jgi:hypothetical protein
MNTVTYIEKRTMFTLRQGLEQDSQATDRRESRRSTSSNTNSLALSDRSEAVSSDSSGRRRPSPQRRPYSDQTQLRRKIAVDTIAEDPTQQFGQPSEPPSPTPRLQAHLSNAAGGTSPVSSPGIDTHSRRRGTSSDGDGRHSSAPSDERPRPGRSRSRTQSGGSWIERLKQSANKSGDSSPKSSGKVSPKSIVPLRPPKLVPSSVGAPDHHNVRVEKSFTSLRATRNEKKEIVEVDPQSRRTSWDPLRFFSAYVQLAKRISLPRRSSKPVEATIAQSRGHPQDIQMPDHKTAGVLKKNRTAEALRRVTSILREAQGAANNISSTSLVNIQRVKSVSEQSTSSKASSAFWKKTARTQKHVPRTTSDSGQPSALAVSSYTSSQLALQMGAQPNNTPDERATYKIKRSPSAESEEFLKIDISVRGGTSYLPSEARRIHTPPLPQDGPDGRKRGFFFDYNAPRASVSNPRDTIDPSSVPSRSTSRKTTAGKRMYLANGRVVTKNRTSDWYEAALARLEDPEDGLLAEEESTALLLGSDTGRERGDTVGSLAEARKRKEEELFDYNIPEHLPSSPLCPRHPRYWRVVKGVGSQFRGCYMHGVGEWELPQR